MQLPGDDYLEDYGFKGLYEKLQQLLVAGKVDRAVARTLSTADLGSKPPQNFPAQASEPELPPKLAAYTTGNYEDDLIHAVQASTQITQPEEFHKEKHVIELVFDGRLPKDTPFVVLSGSFEKTENDNQLLRRFKVEVPTGTGHYMPLTAQADNENQAFRYISVFLSFFKGKNAAQAASFASLAERIGWQFSYNVVSQRGRMFGVRIKPGERIHMEAVAFFSRLFRYTEKHPKRLNLLESATRELLESDNATKMQTAAHVKVDKHYYCTLSVDQKKAAFYPTPKLESSMKALARKIFEYVKISNQNNVTRLTVKIDTEIGSARVDVVESEVIPGANRFLWKNPDKVNNKYHNIKNDAIQPDLREKISALLQQLPSVYFYNDQRGSLRL